jgi:hypothetical protein
MRLVGVACSGGAVPSMRNGQEGRQVASEPLTASSRGAHRLQHNVIHPASVTACIGLFKLGDGECQAYFPQPSLTPWRRAPSKVLELRHQCASYTWTYKRARSHRGRRNISRVEKGGTGPTGPRGAKWVPRCGPNAGITPRALNFPACHRKAVERVRDSATT